MLKPRGYLGGHCLSIGMRAETRIIGDFGRKWMKAGIRNTCRVFNVAMSTMSRCPMGGGEPNSERHLPGGKFRRPLRAARSSNPPQRRDTSPIIPFMYVFLSLHSLSNSS